MIKQADGAVGRPDACWKPVDAIGPASGPLSVRFAHIVILKSEKNQIYTELLTKRVRIRLKCGTQSMPYPSLIVETGYQESWPDLLRDMQDWLGPHTGVQVVVLVKIFKPYTENEGLLMTPKLPSVRMEAQVFRRTPQGPQATCPVVRLLTSLPPSPSSALSPC